MLGKAGFDVNRAFVLNVSWETCVCLLTYYAGHHGDAKGQGLPATV